MKPYPETMILVRHSEGRYKVAQDQEWLMIIIMLP